MPRSLMLIDGENLVTRFEAMVKEGRKKTEGTVYVEGLLVWHPNMIAFALKDEEMVRVAYYTSRVGDDDRINNDRDEIGKIVFNGRGNGFRICPHIFKKPTRSQKIKNVDIGITIDALRHVYQNHIDHLYLLSGDGDYVPLVHEVMRQGKRVTVGALSSGLNPELKRIADSFMGLDSMLFYPPAKGAV